MPLPFESVQKSSPDNSFKGQTPADQAEVHRRSIDEGAKDVKAPLEFRLEQPLNLNGAEVGAQVSSEGFNTAVVLVVATLECGYYPKGPHVHHGQARHACAVLAATGRSYTKHYELGIETTLEEARAEAVDPNPLSNSYPTLFYRLAATAEHIEGHVSPESTVSVGSEKPSISSLRVARRLRGRIRVRDSCSRHGGRHRKQMA